MTLTAQEIKEMNLWNIKDIIKANEDGNFLAICESGKRMNARL